ncbi:uncharacterized protein LOC135140284 [Zophobas morio]|uniref:uncharacterized protein LOC135140284 n=1 Tax=Zophobas morio TaxID=2755281 RepID=UPI003082932D
MSESGTELRNNNERIVKLMALLKAQRDEMTYLITKQQEEKHKIENEIEKLSFKLTLLTKSLNQRLQAKINYDKTIKEIEEHYMNLVSQSGKLLHTLSQEVHDLEEIMDKKIGTVGSGLGQKDLEKKPEEAEKAEEPPPPEDKQSLEGEPLEKKSSIQSKHSSSVTSQHSQKRSSIEQLRSRTSSRTSHEHPSSHPGSRTSSVEHAAKQDESSDPQTEPPPEPNNQRDSHFEKYLQTPPPIKRRNTDDDVELQSYREAYERQHTASSPPHSFNEMSSRRGSTSRRTSTRLSKS